MTLQGTRAPGHTDSVKEAAMRPTEATSRPPQLQRLPSDGSTNSNKSDSNEGPRSGEITPRAGVPDAICEEEDTCAMAEDHHEPEDNAKDIVVSFYLKGDEGETKKEKHEFEENAYIWTMLISTLYAIVIVLVGIAFPLSEALQEEWLVSHEVGAFLTYLFSGSTIFLLYLQVELYFETQNQKKTRRKNDKQEPSLKGASNKHPDQHSGTDVGSVSTNHAEHRCRHPSNVSQKPCDHHENGSVVCRVGDCSAAYQQANLPDSRQERCHGCLSGQIMPLAENLHDPPVDGNCPSPGMEVDSLSVYSPSVCDETYRRFMLLNNTAILKHEGASFYLRLGCMLFGVGNFVFVCLEINTYIFTSTRCNPHDLVYPYWFQLAFLLVQTFFLFKHTTINVKKRKGLVRFGLLHVLATNLCIWLRVLTKEVVEAFERQYQNTDLIANSSFNTSCDVSFMAELSPYLSPFVLEYSLIAVASMAGMFHSLNLRVSTDLMASLRQTVKLTKCQPQNLQSENPDEELFFAKSHRGLYFGVLLLSGTIVSIILFFLNINEDGGYEQAIDFYYSSDIALNFTLSVGVMVGICKIKSLKLTFNKDNTIDDVLMIVSLCGHILLHIFIIIACMTQLTDNKTYRQPTSSLVLALLACFLNIAQGLLQTIYVMDGLHRCASNQEQQKNKPGRGVVTFLILSNIAQWIFKTFQVKELELTNMQNFYGSIAWPLILNVNLPLLLFYRFHSSVCLADIWVSAYKMESMPPGYTAL